MTQHHTTAFINDSDASLVMHALGGNRDAFCTIVTRYQTLLCSIAYSSLGDVKRSEDLAQDAFIEAWRKLDSLREPERLKAWLCGILRFKISHFRRAESGQPTTTAGDVDNGHHNVPASTDIEKEAITAQQESLMWKVLASMDDTYREPLVLFYREQQSVTKVAEELDLSEGTVKQRLSRGRKLLKQAMVDIVEHGLEHTKPGVAFTTAVMLSINTISPPAKAAAAGLSAAKTGSALTAATGITLLASVSGLISTFFGLRAGLAQSRTQREKTLVKRTVMAFLLIALVYTASMFGVRSLAYANPHSAWWLTLLALTIVVLFVASYIWLTRFMTVAASTLRQQERALFPENFSGRYDKTPEASEFVSKWRLWGIPLCHFQFGTAEANYRPAVGWIACGSKAYGLLVAWGGLAVAPISVGIISVGLVSIGAVGFGILGLGTVGIGLIAFGSAAIGAFAYSSLFSAGWLGAFSGSFALSPDAAVGSIAFANNVNNSMAEQAMHLALFEQTYLIGLLVMAALVIFPSMLYSIIVRRKMKTME